MDQAAQIREKTDLVALISQYVPLRKMGANFKANCPFHNEKSPSFVVSPDRQIWHCFGCGKGGDCYSFLMEYENIDFVEALKMLGQKAGIEVSFSSDNKGVTSQKEKIYKMNKYAADFYHYVLTKHSAGKKALTYLTERKIKPQILETFRIGYAPSSSATLSQYLINKKGFKRQDLLDAGLSTIRNGSLADFFFNRIMFPLSDHRGNIVGFSGRVLDDVSGQSSKYVNTKDTLAYHKGEVFFGLDIVKDEIKKAQEAIIMEGEFDVISSYQEGVGNAVAVKGTALTEAQASLISRFAPKVTLCFDEDSAGFEALKRSLPILERKGLTVHVLHLENGKDPDEAIKNDPIVYKKAVKHPVGVYDFLLSKTLQRFDKNSVEGKQKIGEELIPIFSDIENEIVKEVFLKRLAGELDVSLESIYKQIEKIKQKEIKSHIAPVNQKEQKSREEVLEQYSLALILQSENAKECIEIVKDALFPFQYQNPSLGKIFVTAHSYLESHEKFDAKQFAISLPQELLSSFDSCYLLPLSKFESKDFYMIELKKTAETLRDLYVRQKIKEISAKIKIKDKEKHENKEIELEKLQQELGTYIAMLKSQK